MLIREFVSLLPLATGLGGGDILRTKGRGSTNGAVSMVRNYNPKQIANVERGKNIDVGTGLGKVKC